MRVQVDRAARAMVPSRAAFVATVGAPFASSALPPEANWGALLVGVHRTTDSLTAAMKLCQRFANAQLGSATIRGDSFAHLYAEGRGDAGEQVWLQCVSRRWGILRRSLRPASAWLMPRTCCRYPCFGCLTRG